MSSPLRGRRVGARGLSRAFTLMEVLIAVIIIGLGALGLAAMFAGAAGQQRRATVVNQSVSFARNAAAMILRSFGQMKGGRSTDCPPNCKGEWAVAVADKDEYFLTTADRSYFVVPASPYIAFQQTYPQFLSTGQTTPFTPFFPLPHRRIDRENLFVTVTVTEAVDPKIGLGTPKENEYVFQEPIPLVQGEPDTVILYRKGVVASGDSMSLFRAESAGVTGRGRLSAPSLASLVSLFENEQSVSQGYVSKIVVNYKWRNDNLVSLNDRFIHQDDPRMPGGRRPVMGFALLTRVVSGGVSQLAIFTYALEPLSVPVVDVQKEPLFIPPETKIELDADRGLLRKAKLKLGWEKATGQYYVTPANPDKDGWAVERGQLLLVEKLDTAVGDSKAGADGGVRIVAVRSVRNGGDLETRGILDGSPRVLGRSPLRNLNQPVTLSVWAFPSTVRSLSGDGAEWAVRPIETLVVQAPAP